MNKKIKIIELLDNYADEKEIIMPKYVKYYDRIYKTDYIMLVCEENIIDKLNQKMIKLNDEVEILEDNTEEIEELSTYRDIEEFGELDKRCINQNAKEFFDKINELVKTVNSIRKDKNND